MRLDINTEIRYRSGERAGYLQEVLFDDKGNVHEIVLTLPGLIIKRHVRAPLSALAEGEGGVLYINLSKDDVHNLPDYHDVQVPATPGEWNVDVPASAFGEVFPLNTYEPIMPLMEVSDAPQEAFGITEGTEVRCLDGRWGIVDEVLVGDSGETQAFVGRSDNINERDRIIPIELVQQVTEESVALNCTLADLPTYTEELENELEEPEPS